MIIRWTLCGLAAAAVLLAGAPNSLFAQHEGHAPDAPAAPLGIPETRMGSGTSWVPDASSMHAAHYRAGAWRLMLHGLAYLQYDAQGGPRGDEEVDLINWVMLTGTRMIGRGQLQVRAMLSADPWTVGANGYPLLLQSGESYRGARLVDRQHPHDLFMELAVVTEVPVTDGLALSLYLAPVGEPAVGPPAFPHRPSAAGDPFAPLGHHWQDATHIVYGTATAGLFTRHARLEVSAFNGREPDERRTDFDYTGRRIDSYSVRLTANPTANWSLSTWYAYLDSPEELEPDVSLHRLGGAALLVLPMEKGRWSTAVVYALNDPVGAEPASGSVLLETNFEPDRHNSLFARAEYVRKSAVDLGLAGTASYDIGAVALGYVRELGGWQGATVGLGMRAAAGFVPAALEGDYGSRRPLGGAVYLRVKPRGG